MRRSGRGQNNVVQTEASEKSATKRTLCKLKLQKICDKKNVQTEASERSARKKRRANRNVPDKNNAVQTETSEKSATEIKSRRANASAHACTTSISIWKQMPLRGAHTGCKKNTS